MSSPSDDITPGPHRTDPLTVRIPEACRLTGIGRSKLYELISAGEIEIMKVGTITLIPVASLKTFLEQQRTVLLNLLSGY
jgi:excisionase family DNA binding protein